METVAAPVGSASKVSPPAAVELGGAGESGRASRDDALLSCLVIVSRIFGHPKSPEALAAGLPLPTEGMTPPLFVRAAERIGLSATIRRRAFSALTPLNLPCVLLLRRHGACILLRFVDKRTAEVMTPDSMDGVQRLPRSELEAQYDGGIIVVRPRVRLDARSSDLLAFAPRSWFWGSLFRFAPIYGEVILAAFILNALAVALPLFTMAVYDRVVPNRAFDTLWVLAIGILVTLGFTFLLQTLRGLFLERVGRTLDSKLSARVFEQVMSMRLASMPQSSGALAARIQHFEAVREFLTAATMTAIVDLPFVFVFLLVISLVAGPVVIVPAFMIPLAIVGSLICQAPMARALGASYRENQQKHATLIEAIGGIETVKTCNAEGRLQRDWDAYVKASANSTMRSRGWQMVAMNLVGASIGLTSVGILIWSVYRSADGLMTTGAMIAASMLGSRAMAPVAQIVGLVVRFGQFRVALRGLNELMRLPTERPVGKIFLRRPKVDGAIEFRNVDFRYPGQAVKALDGISFRIAAGERVGIVGRIGSGKTTIERLIMGLYEPEEGAVLVDGTDIRQTDPADLRSNIGCVLQDARLFFGSIKDNISLGAPYVDEQSILKAAEVSGVDAFVKRHPHGYDLQVGEGGHNLSGGQRQAVAIARALLMDPPILVLDEPTASMDNSSETAFKTELMRILPGKTLVLVTHRNSMLSLVDRLIIMDNGKVVADGPKTTVMDALNTGRVRAVQS
jgi:ATP-binding cassette subfamily C protein LapB